VKRHLTSQQTHGGREEPIFLKFSGQYYQGHYDIIFVCAPKVTVVNEPTVAVVDGVEKNVENNVMNELTVAVVDGSTVAVVNGETKQRGRQKKMLKTITFCNKVL
jgi:hypothetical protein